VGPSQPVPPNPAPRADSGRNEPPRLQRKLHSYSIKESSNTQSIQNIALQMRNEFVIAINTGSSVNGCSFDLS
jgi:hypothetical protein